MNVVVHLIISRKGTIYDKFKKIKTKTINPSQNSP